MTPNADRLREVFLAALKLPAVARDAFVRESCAGAEELRDQVLMLLQAHDELGTIAPAPEPVASQRSDQPGAPARPGDWVAGRYKLLEPIGEGGMGTVWMAQQTEPVKRLVAVKLIKAGMDSKQVVARFEAERQALALMDHPNIAKVHDAGTAPDGRPYFVMELVKGVPITRYCDEHRLTPRQRLELFLPVCHAVQHAHQKGIIHRDLKPSNVLVALYDGKPVPKVIDFGVAKAAGQSLTDKTLVTGFGAIVGTLEYMSPEQAEVNQLDIDTRSDIYSLGVLLYELLTGSPPFSKKELEKVGMLEMLRVIREQEPSKPSTKLSSSDALPTLSANRGTEPAKLTRLVRGELDWIVMKALEKDRNRRYETANGFAMDVQRYLADEAVQACPPSAGYRLRKFARRNKGGLAVAALVLFFMVLLGSGAGWAWRDRSAREAEAALQQGERQARAGGQIESIFAEVDRLEGEQKWQEALAAARRAEAVVAGGEADAATVGHVRDRLKDLEFIDRLEQLYMDQLLGDGERGSVREDRDYARAFRDYGVDVDKLAVESSIQRLRTRPALAIPLGAALDEWVSARRAHRRDEAGRKRLVAVASGVDPEPLRVLLRSTSTETPEGLAELRRLADSIDPRAHHPVTLMSLGGAVRGYGPSLQFEPALRVLRGAQGVYPGDFRVTVGLIQTLLMQKDFEEAVRFSTAAVALQPRLGYVWLAFALREWGKLDDAEAACRKAIEFARNSREAANSYTILGQILRLQKKPDKAIAACRKAIELWPKSETYESLGRMLSDLGRLDEAVEVYRKGVEIGPSSDTYEKLARALRAIKRSDEADAAFDKAIELQRRAMERDPSYVPAYWFLCDMLLEWKKWSEAVEASRKAIEFNRNPKAAHHYYTLGHGLLQLKKWDEAAAASRKATEIDTEFAHSYADLGVALYHQQKLDEAVVAFRKAIEFGLEDVSRNLGIALIEKFHQFRKMKNAAGCLAVVAEYEALKLTDVASKLYDAACLRALCTSTILEDPKTPATDAARLARKQADLAMAWLHKAVAAGFKNARHMKQDKDLDPLRDREDFKKFLADLESNRPLNDLAWELATHPDPSRRDPKRAVELAEKAVAELPKDANCWNTLGVARYRAGDHMGAVAALMKHRELRTNDAEWTNPFFLAMARWKLDHKDEAARWYKLAVEWMERTKADSEMMRRVRAEAAELLAVEKKKD
jgi:tetratricopeptide (TPR) repeat protein